ncbi:MAG: hypothetical protein IJY28_09075 [Clostridia bacterium]|nr:hypothetical protein [Clostridia bacterium]
MMPKFLLVDSLLSKEVQSVLDEVGIDIDTVIKMTLKRIARDGSVAFLLAENGTARTGATEERRMTKGQAVSLFQAQGVSLTRNVTFASKNRTANNYWNNPTFDVLAQDWYLILNDWANRELHLFCVPAGAIRPEELVCRGDQQDRIDLQIRYGDPTFTENRSKLQFAKYRVQGLNY